MAFAPLQRRTVAITTERTPPKSRAVRNGGKHAAPQVMPAGSPAERTAERASQHGLTGSLAGDLGATHAQSGGKQLEPALTEHLHVAQDRAPTRLRGGEFGMKAGDLRVHADPSSALVAKAMGASAFSYQGEAYVDPTYYRPKTAEGRHLLAHEAAHITGQRRAHTNADEQPYIHRKMHFTSGAAEAKYTMYEGSDLKLGISREPTMELSDPLFEEWDQGLRTYLGLRSDIFVDNVNGRISIEKVTRKSNPVIANNPWLQELQSVVADRLNSFWGINVFLAYPVPGPAAVFKGEIHINQKIYPTMVVAVDSSWSGFWILLHELLHVIDNEVFSDPYVKDENDRVVGHKGYLPMETQEREFNWRGGGRSRENLTIVGTADQVVNKARALYDLPTRETYSDSYPRPGVVRPEVTVFRQQIPGGDSEDFIGVLTPTGGSDEESDPAMQQELFDKPLAPSLAQTRAREATDQAAQEIAQAPMRRAVATAQRYWTGRFARFDRAEIATGDPTLQTFTLSLRSSGSVFYGFFTGEDGARGRVLGKAEPVLSSPNDLRPDYVNLTIEWQPQSTGKTYKWGFKVPNGTLNAINDGAGKMIYSGINPDPEPGQQKAPQLGLHYPRRR